MGAEHPVQPVPGLSSIVLLFEPGTDIIRGRQMVQERLIQAGTLPKVSKPPVMLQPLSSAGRVMMVGLSSRSLSLMELSVLSRWTIRPRLMGVAGVANVAVWGHRERQLQVMVDPKRLQSRQVTMDQVIRTTGNALWVSPLSYFSASTPGSGGFIDTPNQRLGIRHVLPITTPADLAKVPVEGAKVTLGEVADVVEEHQPLIGAAAGPSGQELLLVIEKLPGANLQAVTNDLDGVLDALAPGIQGVEVNRTVYRPATFVDQALGNLWAAGLIALLLIAVVVGALILRLRVVAITLISVAVSAVAALLVLHLRGATMNLMVAAGLALATILVIDDVVGDVTNVLRRLRQEGEPRTRLDTIVEAVAQSRRPVAYATLMALLLLVPVLLSTTMAPSFLRATVTAYVLALAASFAVSLTVTPALCALLLRKQPPGRRPRHVAALERVHALAYRGAVRRPMAALMATGIVLALGVASASQLEWSLHPSFKERDLLITVKAVPGTSNPEMSRVSSRVAAELRTISGVRQVGAQVGRAVMSDQRSSVDSGQLWLNLTEEADYDATLDDIAGVLHGYPGLLLQTQTYLTKVARDTNPARAPPVVVRLRGPDGDILTERAQAVRTALVGVRGIAAPQVEQQIGQPEIEVQVDLDAAGRFGVKPGDVRRAATTLLSGLEVGSLFEEQKVFEVMVVGAPHVRHSLHDIAQLPIQTPSGKAVPLADVAKIQITRAAANITREGVNRRLDVTAGLKGRSRADVERDVQAALSAVKLPREHHAELLEPSDTPSGSPLWLVALATLAGIYLLVQAAVPAGRSPPLPAWPCRSLSREGWLRSWSPPVRSHLAQLSACWLFSPSSPATCCSSSRATHTVSTSSPTLRSATSSSRSPAIVCCLPCCPRSRSALLWSPCWSWEAGRVWSWSSRWPWR